MEEHRMNPVSQEAQEQIFTKARTHSAWLDKPVPGSLLHHIYDLMTYGPTSANTGPARLVFVKSKEAKAKLLPCLAPPNAEQTKAAPVTAMVAMDMAFEDRLPQLRPQTGARAWLP